MEISLEELEKMDIETLSTLYSKQLKYLNQQLIEGTPWEELAQHRKALTRIGVVLDVKLAARLPNR